MIHMNTEKSYVREEWFSIECDKINTKVIALTNHKGHKQSSEPINLK